MAAISFKNVGELSTEKKFKKQANEIPIGIKTPMHLGNDNDGIFSMHFDAVDQIRDNFKNLLLTNHGERLLQYDFGANLRELSMEMTSEAFDLEAITRIKVATQKYMPFIDLQTFEKSIDRIDNKHTALVKMKIVYNIPALKTANQATEIRFYIAG